MNGMIEPRFDNDELDHDQHIFHSNPHLLWPLVGKPSSCHFWSLNDMRFMS